ncbi:MAG: hypothetical protein K8U03_02555, partial [Planctomycetia bacterium]|nr:hypothetical protein [Planctomycetia bacterium]
MSPVVPSVAAESAPSRRRPWLRRLEYVGRVVVAGFVLWICWSVATTFSLLVRDDAPQRPTT